MKASSFWILLALLATVIVGMLFFSDNVPAPAPTPKDVEQSETPSSQPPEEKEIAGPRGISRKVYKEWRSPRFGTKNPQHLTNPVWQWLTEEKPDPTAADALFRLSAADSVEPAWTFNRIGASETALPDGRTVWAGGRHGEPGGPNYHVYNDLIVKDDAGAIAIEGYPKSIFPPTHSHSATLVSNYILLIGGLGEVGSEPRETTQIRAIRIEKFRIEPWKGIGQGPGAIHGHTAELSDNELWIEVSGGFIQSTDGSSEPNPKRWRLDMDTLYWSELPSDPESEVQ